MPLPDLVLAALAALLFIAAVVIFAVKTWQERSERRGLQRHRSTMQGRMRGKSTAGRRDNTESEGKRARTLDFLRQYLGRRIPDAAPPAYQP